MPHFSLSLQKPARVGEPKTTFNAGALAPTLGEAVEIRVDTAAYSDKRAFWADLNRLLQRMRELQEPRPEFSGPFAFFPDLYLLEDGTSHYRLEDGTGFIALE